MQLEILEKLMQKKRYLFLLLQFMTELLKLMKNILLKRICYFRMENIDCI